MAEGMMATDSEGKVTFINAAAGRLLGWRSADMLGESAHACHSQRADGTPNTLRTEHFRGSVLVFDDISERLAEQLRLERELEKLSWVGRIRDALDQDRFVLYT